MDNAIYCCRHKHVARQGEKFVGIDMIILGECAQGSFLEHVLLSGFDIYSFGIVDRGMRVADADDVDAALVSERERCH